MEMHLEIRDMKDKVRGKGVDESKGEGEVIRSRSSRGRIGLIVSHNEIRTWLMSIQVQA